MVQSRTENLQWYIKIIFHLVAIIARSSGTPQSAVSWSNGTNIPGRGSAAAKTTPNTSFGNLPQGTYVNTLCGPKTCSADKDCPKNTNLNDREVCCHPVEKECMMKEKGKETTTDTCIFPITGYIMLSDDSLPVAAQVAIMKGGDVEVLPAVTIEPNNGQILITTNMEVDTQIGPEVMLKISADTDLVTILPGAVNILFGRLSAAEMYAGMSPEARRDMAQLLKSG